MSKESEEFVNEIMAKDSERVQNALRILMQQIDESSNASLRRKKILVKTANRYIAGLCMDKETEDFNCELYEAYKYRIINGEIVGYKPAKTKRTVIT